MDLLHLPLGEMFVTLAMTIAGLCTVEPDDRITKNLNPIYRKEGGRDHSLVQVTIPHSIELRYQYCGRDSNRVPLPLTDLHEYDI
jgi:hypothetical protein